jgi:hypothetical protein
MDFIGTVVRSYKFISIEDEYIFVREHLKIHQGVAFWQKCWLKTLDLEIRNKVNGGLPFRSVDSKSDW